MINNYVITIARGFGSGGKEIAAKVAERLGIPCYERQILQMASEYSGLSEELFSRVDEKLRGNYAVNSLSKFAFSEHIEPQNKRFESDINLFCIQSEIMKELVHTTSCVIIGKCADFVLKAEPNVASFYVEAPRAQCLESVMSKTGVSEKEAAKLIQHTDKYRADYYRFYTGGNYWTNPVNYDLTLNSARVGRSKCVDVIIDYLKVKFGDDFNMLTTERNKE
jgi:cytidylate kinase